MIEKEVLDYIKDKEEVSISSLQRNLGLGFPSASRIFNELIRENYIIKHPQSGRFFVDKKLSGG